MVDQTSDPTDGKRFRKLPIEVEAIRWDGSMESQAQIVTWSRGVIEGMFGSLFHEEDRYYLLVPTLHGLTAAEVGDWVVRGPSGDYWPVKPGIFTESYASIPTVDDATRQEVETLVADQTPHVCGSCGGTGWVEDEGWSAYEFGPPARTRVESDGLVPCGRCGDWHVRRDERTKPTMVVDGWDSEQEARAVELLAAAYLGRPAT